MYTDNPGISIVYAARYRGLNVHEAHTHNEIFQLYILNNDRLELFDGENAVTPDSENEIIIIKPSEKHSLRLSYRANNRDWFDGDINCAFDCKFFVTDPALYETLMALPRTVKVKNMPFFRHLADITLNALNKGDTTVARSTLHVLIYELALESIGVQDAGEPLFYTNNSDFHADISGIKDIKNYIDANYTQRIELNELVRISRMNRSTLCREFRRVYDTSPIHYILQKRVDEAKIYLAESSMKINELSEKLGFSSPSYFNRVFKNYVGQNPGEYRSNNQSLSVRP